MGKPVRLYPDIADRHLGLAVPEPIREAFSKARACFTEARAYTACAIERTGRDGSTLKLHEVYADQTSRVGG